MTRQQLRINLWPLKQNTKSWHPGTSIQTLQHRHCCLYFCIDIITWCHMFTVNITWKGLGFRTCRKYVKNTSKICHCPMSGPTLDSRFLAREVVTIKTWLEMQIPKLQLNLGPIISAPAAKGNFVTGPRSSHHTRGRGVMETHLRQKSHWVSRSFVPVSRQSPFCLWDAGAGSFFSVYALIFQYNLKLSLGRTQPGSEMYSAQMTFLWLCDCKLLVAL